MKKLVFSTIALLCIVSLLWAQTDKKLNKLFIEINTIEKAYAIQNTLWRGEHPEEYTFQKVDAQIELANELQPKLQSLIEIPDDKLSSQNKINKQIKILQLQNSISQVTYKTYLIPFNSEGGFFNQPSFFLPNLPFKTKENYEDYLRWLPSFADYIRYNQELLEQGIKENIQAPKVIVQNILSLLEPWTLSDITQNPFYQPFIKMPDEISLDTQNELQDRVKSIIEKNILPSYKELADFLNDKYLVTAPDNVGISEIENGVAYYEDRVRHFTTLDLSPDSVFQIGQDEVLRIKGLMNQVIEDLNYKGSFADFIQFLRTDEQFYPKSGQELLNYAAWLSKKAEGQLPRLFSKLYELPFTVAPVPDAIAPNYTGGRYVPGNRKQNRPGTYWVNTYNLPSRTLYTLPALSLHEAVPGHHLQGQIAKELKGLPDFRSGYYISAFGEGWGLYSEYLGEEMGMYETPYDLFGRYTYEMWRACRLVVDVGMHYKGWTREEAVKFMSENTALSLHEVNTEIDRYIGWPGQALSYKIGELTIKKMRAKASLELGDQFDIQAFHHAILKNGSVPLLILEKEIDSYIADQKGN